MAIPGLRRRFRPAIEALSLGLLIGLIDVHSKSGDWFNALPAYVVAAFVLAVRHAGRAWQAWLPLSASLYLTHVLAIACGYRPPYVEEDIKTAGFCLNMAWPVGLGLGFGAFVRFFVSVVAQSMVTNSGATTSNWPDVDVAHRAKRPDLRAVFFRRRTISDVAVMVAVIAVHLAFARLLLQNDPFFGFCTFYSTRYSESRFNALQVGMTAEEVEAAIGPPIRKLPWSDAAGGKNSEMWTYSARRDETANFWRRWVLFENDKVVSIISDFWVD